MSGANQKTVRIHQSKEIPFLKIGIKEGIFAYQHLKPSSFALYLYLASNQEGYKFELSQVAFTNQIGPSKSSYHRGIQELIEYGFLYQDAFGHWQFSPCPNFENRVSIQDWEDDSPSMNNDSFKDETNLSHERTDLFSEMNREIDNKEEQIIIDNIDTGKEIEKLEDDDLESRNREVVKDRMQRAKRYERLMSIEYDWYPHTLQKMVDDFKKQIKERRDLGWSEEELSIGITYFYENTIGLF